MTSDDYLELVSDSVMLYPYLVAHTASLKEHTDGKESLDGHRAYPLWPL
jgi:hypothetical protein